MADSSLVPPRPSRVHQTFLDYFKVGFRDDDGVMDRRVNLLRSLPKRHLDAGDGPIGGDGGKVVRETSVISTA